MGQQSEQARLLYRYRTATSTYLAFAHAVHIPLCDVLALAMLAEVLELFFRAWHPVWVNVEHLEAA